MSALSCLVALGCGSGSGGEDLGGLSGGSKSLPSAGASSAGGSGTPAVATGGMLATVFGGQGGGTASSAGARDVAGGAAGTAQAAPDPEDDANAGAGGSEPSAPSEEPKAGAPGEDDAESPPPTQAHTCPDVGLTAAKVHYVCDCQSGADASCKAGNDSGAGTISAPFKTYQRARKAFSELNAGETVAFCRGGSFSIDGDRRWVNAKCRANEPCVVRDYVPTGGKADLAKPILTASSGDGFALDDSAGANHEEGYKFLNLDVRSSSKGQQGNGFFVYNDIDDVEICGTDLSGFDIGIHSATSNSPEAGSDGKNARVTLANAVVKDNGSQGYLGGCDGCGVSYSKFENNGFNDPVLDHNIYFGPRGADGMFAIGNDLYRAANIGGKCEGNSLVVHGRVTNLLIEGNTVREDVGKASAGCWGIAVDTGYGSEEESFENVTIRGNTVTNVGNVSIGVNACKNCVIENNVVVQQQPIQGTLIAAADRSRDDNDLAMTNVTIRNNTLFASSTASITGISLGSEGTGHVSVSNALLSQGSGEFRCFNYGLPAGSYATRDNNLCHATSTPEWASQGATLTAFRAAANADMASLDVDPEFVSTVAPFDFTPKLGSPLLNQGNSLSATRDLAGKSRGTAPDIGALER